MKKLAIVALTLALAGGVLTACGSDNSSAPNASNGSNEPAAQSTEQTDVEMKYLAPADVKASLDAKDDKYLIVDVRKAADYDAKHIPTAVGIDMDAAKEGDLAAGETAMKEGLKEATGSETGGDAQIVLVCYSGARYAQAATNVLSNLGANLDNVTTLEGGMKAWEASYADDVEAA